MPDQATTSIIVAGSSALVAITLAVTTFLERRQQQKEQTLLRALECLTGGSQKRSVGIAMIEGLWYKGHPYHRAILPALTNQAIYLLLETPSSGRSQFHNWLRIMELILRPPAAPEFHDLYCELSEALRERATEDETPNEGLQITPTTSKLWLKRIHDHGGLGSVI